MLSLPRFSPGHMAGLLRRSGSPPGGSTFRTRAPRSASVIEQNGPGRLTVRSTTVMWVRGIIGEAQAPSSRLTRSAPFTIASSFRYESHLGSWKKPQSGLITSCSAGPCRMARRMRSATSSGLST